MGCGRNTLLINIKQMFMFYLNELYFRSQPKVLVDRNWDTKRWKLLQDYLIPYLSYIELFEMPKSAEFRRF